MTTRYARLIPGCWLLFVFATPPPARCQAPARMSLPAHPSLVVHSVRTTGGTLSGQIVPVDSVDGFNSFVSLLRPRSGLPDSLLARVRTKSDGRFQFTTVSSGPAVLRAFAIGYESLKYQVVVEPAGDSLVVMHTIPFPVNFVLCAGTCGPDLPRGTLTGSVRCEDQPSGMPPELTVEVRGLRGDLQVRTDVDSRGRFTLPRVWQGSLLITVRQRFAELAERRLELRGDLLQVSPFVLRCEP